MRPVIVCQSNVAGGAEAYLVRLYDALGEKGFKPKPLGSIPGWVNAGHASREVKLGPRWGLATMAKGILRLPAERRRIAWAVESNASFYHLQFKREQIGFTDVLRRTAPVVWTEHAKFPKGTKGKLLAPGYKVAAQKTSSIICVSDDVAATPLTAGKPSETVRLGGGEGLCDSCGHLADHITSPAEVWLRRLLRLQSAKPQCATADRNLAMDDMRRCSCRAACHGERSALEIHWVEDLWR